MDALRERARIVVEYSHSLPTRYRRWQSIVQHFSTYLREWYGRSHATSSECKGLRAISNLMIITSKIRHGHMGYISSQENRKPSESECREKRKPKGIRVSNAKGRSAGIDSNKDWGGFSRLVGLCKKAISNAGQLKNQNTGYYKRDHTKNIIRLILTTATQCRAFASLRMLKERPKKRGMK